eukprot:6951315-Prymnesium_polylepis.1
MRSGHLPVALSALCWRFMAHGAVAPAVCPPWGGGVPGAATAAVRIGETVVCNNFGTVAK